jgi:hypothetical protein
VSRVEIPATLGLQCLIATLQKKIEATSQVIYTYMLHTVGKTSHLILFFLGLHGVTIYLPQFKKPAQEIEAKCQAVMPQDTCRVTCASGYFEEELLGEKLVAGESWDFFG